MEKKTRSKVGVKAKRTKSKIGTEKGESKKEKKSRRKDKNAGELPPRAKKSLIPLPPPEEIPPEEPLPVFDSDEWIPIDANDPQQHDIASAFCAEIAEEFWTEAEDIFMTRHIHRQKSWRIAFELRNTWLRILECLNMDYHISTKDGVLPLSLIKVDTPPLPLSNDLWSRGNLELFPKTRRESVLDPFIRRKRLGEMMTAWGRSASVKSISSMPSWQLELFAMEDEEEDLDNEAVMEDTGPPKKSDAEEIGGGGEGRDGTDHKIDDDSKSENEEELMQLETSNALLGGGDASPKSSDLQQVPLSSPVSMKLFSEEEELLVLKEAASWLSLKSSHSGLKPWTISEKRIGAEVAFTLFGQSTTEAIRQRSEMKMAMDKELQKAKDQIGHKSKSESDLNRVELLSLDDPGTESLYENAAINTDESINSSQPPSQVSSESNMITGKAVFPVFDSDESEVQTDSENISNEEDGVALGNPARKIEAILDFQSQEFTPSQQTVTEN